MKFSGLKKQTVQIVEKITGFSRKAFSQKISRLIFIKTSPVFIKFICEFNANSRIRIFMKTNECRNIENIISHTVTDFSI